MILLGQLTDHLGGCRYIEAVPGGPVGFEVRSRFTVEEVDIRSIAPDCEVTDRHEGGRVLGIVQYAEVTPQGDAYIVADVDSLDVAGDRDGSLYLSLEAHARDGALDVSRVVLTSRPAQPLRPIKIADAGRLADLAEVTWLRMANRDPFTSGLLQRAHAAARARRPGDPVFVHRANAVDVPTFGGPARPTPVYDERGRPVSEWWHSTPTRVLSVR